jgi:hypothetical protein
MRFPALRQHLRRSRSELRLELLVLGARGRNVSLEFCAAPLGSA